MRAVASARLSTPGGRISSMRLVQSAPGSAAFGGVYSRICADAPETPIAASSASIATLERASVAITASFLTLTAHLPVRKTRDSAGGRESSAVCRRNQQKLESGEPVRTLPLRSIGVLVTLAATALWIASPHGAQAVDVDRGSRDY